MTSQYYACIMFISRKEQEIFCILSCLGNYTHSINVLYYMYYVIIILNIILIILS